jgi:DNA-binding response OmpR family regulator
MKMLLIDDDENLLEALKEMLEAHQHEVECSDTAREAVKKVKGTTYDCILVDYRMPRDDGVWFMENAEITSGTKVLLMTAYLNREVINRMFSLGAAGYIIKPFDEEELLAHLNFHGK